MKEVTRDSHPNIDKSSIIASKGLTRTKLSYFFKYERLPLNFARLSKTKDKTQGRSEGYFVRDRDSGLEYLAKFAFDPRTFKTPYENEQQQNEIDYDDIAKEHIFSEFALLFLNRRTARCSVTRNGGRLALLSKLIPNLETLEDAKKRGVKFNYYEFNVTDILASTLLTLNFDIHPKNTSYINGILGFVDHGRAGYLEPILMQSMPHLMNQVCLKINKHISLSQKLTDFQSPLGKIFIQDLFISIINKTYISKDTIEIIIDRKISDLIALEYDLNSIHECFFSSNPLAAELFERLKAKDKKQHLVKFITETLNTHFSLLRAFALNFAALDPQGLITIPERKGKFSIDLPPEKGLVSLAKIFERTEAAKVIRSASPFCNTYNLSENLFSSHPANLHVLINNIDTLSPKTTVNFTSIPHFLCSTTFRTCFGRDFNQQEKEKLISFAKNLISEICKIRCKKPELKKAILEKTITPSELVLNLYTAISRKNIVVRTMLNNILNVHNPAEFIKEAVENSVLIK